MTQNPIVPIGKTRVGANNPVYIIAEAGVNHGGDIAKARTLIDVAHEAGADAVKFQVFSADRLVAPSAPSCGYQKQHDAHAATQHEMLKGLELDAAAFAELKAYADQRGIHFLATPFGTAELALLVELDVPAVKIASSDLVNVPLLTAAAETGLPLIVSTGASTLSEIDQAVRLIHSRRADGQLILLHCVSAYPTRPEDARLRCIQTLARRFGVPVGFSDHTPDPTFGALAAAAGAVVLEKHLTLDRSAPGPDHFFSLQPEQFAQYVAGAHRAHSVLGDGQIGVAPEEAEVRKLARGSVVTAEAIVRGQRISPDHLAVRRPGDGIDPARWHEVVGRIAKADIPAETPLAWSMLES